LTKGIKSVQLKRCC